ncbi:hypothetical protein C8R46DRAFT_1331477 [Mycena filopes]|nr:hypothetical protein C8R46DRAFT_1331477 [Mycena filopes]
MRRSQAVPLFNPRLINCDAVHVQHSSASSTMRCQCTDRSSRRYPSDPIVPGDICAVEVPVDLPFVQTIVQSMGVTPDPLAVAHHRRLKNPAKLFGKLRPCVILPSENDNLEEEICLMATFDGEDPTNLANIYQEFILSVVSTQPKCSPEQSTKYKPELETSPRWSCGTQWIISIPIRPDTCDPMELDIWGSNGADAPPVHLCESMLRELTTACRTRRDDWDKKIRNQPVLLKEYYDDLKAKCPPTVASGTTAPSQRSQQSRHSQKARAFSFGGAGSLLKERFARVKADRRSTGPQSLHKVAETAEPPAVESSVHFPPLVHANGESGRRPPGEKKDSQLSIQSRRALPSASVIPPPAPQQGEAPDVVGPTMATQFAAMSLRKKPSLATMASVLRRASPSLRSASGRAPSVRGVPSADAKIVEDLAGCAVSTSEWAVTY